MKGNHLPEQILFEQVILASFYPYMIMIPLLSVILILITCLCTSAKVLTMQSLSPIHANEVTSQSRDEFSIGLGHIENVMYAAFF